MKLNAINKPYAVFLIAWLVIFVFCSILSGISASPVTADTTKTDKSAQTSAPQTSDLPSSDQTAATTDGATPPETSAPETDPPETSASENDPPETSAPETSAPETDPEVGAPIALPSDPGNARYMIYLDAGHGWSDVGCSILDRTDVYEKDITLAITKKIQAALEEMGYTVRMSRENDETCVETLVDGIYRSARRIAYANNLGADYYVSIHVDSFAEKPEVSGTRIYYRDRYDGNGKLYPSKELSDQIATSLADVLHTDKPILKDDRNYNVIILNHMPAVLIEVGFGSNLTDAANMTNENWQQTFAYGVALGIDAQVKAGAAG